MRPAPEWKIKDGWSAKSEKLHGISLAYLREHGLPAAALAAVMNRELDGWELLSDDPSYDERWLGQMYEAAGAKPSFVIGPTPARVVLESLARERNLDPTRFQKAWDEARQNRR